MKDIDNILDRLKKARLFAASLSDADRAYLAQRLAQVLDHARGFIEKRLAAVDPANDGKVTVSRLTCTHGGLRRCGSC